MEMTGWWTSMENWRPPEERVSVSASQFSTAAHHPWKTQERRFPHSHSARCFPQYKRGHFYRVKEGDILMELAQLSALGVDVGRANLA
jgi:hypothetical protein